MIYLFGQSIDGKVRNIDYQDGVYYFESKPIVDADFVYIADGYYENIDKVYDNMVTYLASNHKVEVKSFDRETLISIGSDGNRYHLGMRTLNSTKVSVTAASIKAYLEDNELFDSDTVYFDKGSFLDTREGQAVKNYLNGRLNVSDVNDFYSKYLIQPKLMIDIYKKHRKGFRISNNLESVISNIPTVGLTKKDFAGEKDFDYLGFMNFYSSKIGSNSANDYFTKKCGMIVSVDFVEVKQEALPKKALKKAKPLREAPGVFRFSGHVTDMSAGLVLPQQSSSSLYNIYKEEFDKALDNSERTIEILRQLSISPRVSPSDKELLRSKYGPVLSVRETNERVNFPSGSGLNVDNDNPDKW